TEMGLLIGTSFGIFYAILGVPLARLADKWNRHRLILIGALVWTLATSASGFANALAVLVILRAGVAVGEACLSPAAKSMISDLFPRDKRTLPTSIYICIGGTGSMFAFIF